MSGEGVKLTVPMVTTLQRIERRGHIGMSVWVAGRTSCKALLARGLIETGRGGPIGKFDGNPLVRLTDAGRAALAGDRT